MNHAREDAATFIAEYEYDVEQGRRLSVDASAEAVNVLERAVNCIDHQAARIRELEGALRGAIDHMTTCGTALRVGALSNASAVVYLCGGQGAIGAAEEARRVLGGAS